jgi:hypothetical protein
MKKIKTILLAAALPLLIVLGACDGDTTTSKPKPTLTFQTGSGFTFSDAQASVDSILVLGIRATSNDQKLKSIKITQSTNGGTPATLWDTTVSGKVLNYDYDYEVSGGVTDVITLTVTATDDNGETATQSLKVEIYPAQVPLGTQGGQIIYNMQSPTGYNGAYDLNTSTGKFVTDPSIVKDIIDLTTTSGTFPKSWGTSNGTKFAKVTADDYNNATNSNFIYNLWKNNAANATATISNIALGDVYVIKSGQSVRFNLYVLKVTEVKTTTTDNLDYIKFDYKGDI